MTALKGGQPDCVPIQLFGSTGYSAAMENYDKNWHKLLAHAKKYADLQYGWHEPLSQIYAGMFTGVEIKEFHEEKNGKVLTTKVIDTGKGPVTQVSENDKNNATEWKIKKHFITNDDDFDRMMSIPAIPYQPDPNQYYQRVEDVGEKGVVITFFTGPVDVAALYMDPTEFAIWTIDQKDKLHALLEKIAGNMSVYLDYLLSNKLGEVFLFGGAEEVIPPLGNPNLFDEYIMMYEKPFVERIHDQGRLAMLHCHSCVKTVMDKIIATGYDAIQPLEPPPMGDITMAEAKEATKGTNICLVGNIELSDMYELTPDEIDGLVKETIAEGKPGGGFILCVSSCLYETVLSDKVLDNYIAYIDAGRKYGKY